MAAGNYLLTYSGSLGPGPLRVTVTAGTLDLPVGVATEAIGFDPDLSAHRRLIGLGALRIESTVEGAPGAYALSEYSFTSATHEQSWLMDWTPSGRGPFRIGVVTNPDFNGADDHVLSWGYNQKRGGGRINTDEPSVYLGLECWYRQTPGDPTSDQTEFYLSHVGLDESEEQYRTLESNFLFRLDAADIAALDDPSMPVSLTTSINSINAPVTINYNKSAAVVFTGGSTLVYGQRPFSFIANGDKVLLSSRRSGGQDTTVLQHFTFGGGGSSNGLALGGSAWTWMQINGAAVTVGEASSTVGFYGSGGATKGTVSGSRGGNVALANLITYLANRGLLTDGTSA